MALKIQARVEQAEKRLAELKALMAKQAAKKKAAEGKEKRRIDNKKKILLGAYLLDRMERDANSHRKVLEGLDGFLTRPADRAVFGLSVAMASQKAEAQETPPTTDDLPPSDADNRSAAADEWSKKAIEVSNRVATDENYRKELAKRIR